MTRDSTRLSRRHFMQAAGVAAVALASPRPLLAQKNADVIVIGAGLSGLTAALALQDAGMNVKVIEGRNRVGGRVLSYRTVPGNPEAGGTSFGPGYARLINAANTFGVGIIELIPVLRYYIKRELFLNGQHIPLSDWPDHPLNPFPEGAREVPPWAYMGGFLARNNPLATADAWVDPANAALDIPFYEWLKAQGQSDATIQLAYDTEPTHGNSAQDVSALMMMQVTAFIAAQRTLAKPGQSPFMTAVGGNQAIPEAMAGALDAEIEFRRNVSAIRSENNQAEVHCADGTKLRADFVVCSVPCPVLRRIRMDPLLSDAQARAVQTLDSQIINQAHMVARSPFWEADGLSPNMFSNGLVCNLVGEHKGDKPEDVSSLTAWIRGNKAALLDQLPETEARAAIIADIERVRPAAKGQLELVEYKSWYRDPFSSGDWAVWKPGQVSDFATAVATPNGRIHFCGEHTAVSNRGMEGAMESGERVALEILERVARANEPSD